MQNFRLPLPPWRAYKASFLPADALAALAVLFLAVPQGLAYATVAELPPAVGLFAAAIPAIVGSLLRSSSHVVAGPTNAVSLLVGGAILAGLGQGDPVGTALTLALLVGVFQVTAGVLRLGAIVDYISSAVVLGYITGAAGLIGLGQLYNVVGTSGPRGTVWITISGWVDTLPNLHPLALGFTLATVAVVLALRWFNARTGKRIPGAIVTMSLAIAVNIGFGLESYGLGVVSDVQAIPSGLPPLTIPGLGRISELLPMAIACTVLSLVESSAVARSIAAKTGQRLEPSTEFFGQGMSNIAAAFFGGYPVGGSLGRSALNHQSGARTRVAGILSGVFMLGVLLALGPVLNHTPLPALAGLLVVVAWDLVDVPRIRKTVRSSKADALAFVATVLGTWVTSLDNAIYLGAGISIVLFLRNARFLKVRELIVGEQGILKERSPGESFKADQRCPRIKILHIEGSLFFGAAGELQTALDDATRDPIVEVLIVRLKRSRSLDATTAAVFESTAKLLHAKNRHLILVGMRPDIMEVLERSGVASSIGEANIIPTREKWFSALDAARDRAVALCQKDCQTCPFSKARFTTNVPGESMSTEPTEPADSSNPK